MGRFFPPFPPFSSFLLSLFPSFISFLLFFAPFFKLIKSSRDMGSRCKLSNEVRGGFRCSFDAIKAHENASVCCKYCSISVQQNLKTEANVFFF